MAKGRICFRFLGQTVRVLQSLYNDTGEESGFLKAGV